MPEEQKGMELQDTFAPLPVPERGYGFHLYATDKGKKANHFLYAHKSHCVMRSLEDPTKCVIFSGHKTTTDVKVARFAPAGGWVCSGDATGKVIIWPSMPNADGERNAKLELPVNKCVSDVSWDPDGKRIVAVGDSGDGGFGMVFQWDSGNTIGNVNFHSKKALSCDYKPSRPFRIVTSSEDNSVAIFNGPPFNYDKKADPANKDHERYPNKVKFAPDGSKYISVGSDKKIQVFDGKTGEKTGELVDKEQGHKGAIYNFDWNKDGSKIVTVSADKTAKIWNVADSKVEATAVMGTTVEDMQMGVVWLNDYIVTVSLNGRLTYINEEGKITQVLEGHSGTVSCAAVHRGGDANSYTLVTGDSAGKVSVWTKGAAKWLKGSGHGKAIRCVGISADGSKVYSAGNDDSLIVSSTSSGDFGSDKIKIGGAATSIACAHGSDLAVVTVSQGKVAVYKDGSLTSLDVKYKPTSCVLSADDSVVAVGGDDKKVHLYKLDGTSLKEAGECGDHTRAVRTVAMSPCGRFVVSSGDDNAIQVFEGDKKRNPSDWSYHTARVSSVAWSPDGKRVASVSNDQNLFIFEDCEKFSAANKKKQLAHDREIIFVDWLDANTLLTVGLDGVVKTWKA